MILILLHSGKSLRYIPCCLSCNYYYVTVHTLAFSRTPWNTSLSFPETFLQEKFENNFCAFFHILRIWDIWQLPRWWRQAVFDTFLYTTIHFEIPSTALKITAFQCHSHSYLFCNKTSLNKNMTFWSQSLKPTATHYKEIHK